MLINEVSSDCYAVISIVLKVTRYDLLGGVGGGDLVTSDLPKKAILLRVVYASSAKLILESSSAKHALSFSFSFVTLFFNLAAADRRFGILTPE